MILRVVLVLNGPQSPKHVTCIHPKVTLFIGILYDIVLGK
jgi:hypothetical protein